MRERERVLLMRAERRMETWDGVRRMRRMVAGVEAMWYNI
jgi:hypothetical protein